MNTTRQGTADARRRLFVARFFYEGNSFGPLVADRAAFEKHEWTHGAEAVRRAAGSIGELAALPGFAARHPSWSIHVSRCASAIPAGPIADEVFEAFLAEVLAALESALERGGLDAIYLSLHGAAMTQSRPHPDLDLIEAIRARCPELPLAATFDMHANLHPRIAKLLTIGAGYRSHPHVDMRDVAGRILDRLAACVENAVGTVGCLGNTGLLLPSINMRTSDGPMRRLQEAAIEAEEREGVLAASIFGGFPYADAAHTGASALVYTVASHDPDGTLARQVADGLAQALHAARDEFFVSLPAPAEGLAQALASRGKGLIGITDAADNPYSGGAADTPGLLPALLEASPEVPCIFASFADRETVEAAKHAGLGNAFDAQLGARHGTLFGNPVPVRVIPVRFTSGRYRGTAGLLDGTDVQLGDTALLAVAHRPNIRIIVTSRVDPCIDPAFFELHGIDLAQERLLLVKGKNHFRAAAGSRCAEIIDVDAPGPACLDFTCLPYRNRAVSHA